MTCKQSPEPPVGCGRLVVGCVHGCPRSNPLVVPDASMIRMPQRNRFVSPLASFLLWPSGRSTNSMRSFLASGSLSDYEPSAGDP